MRRAAGFFSPPPSLTTPADAYQLFISNEKDNTVTVLDARP